jgi:hypothetical protein
MAPGDSIRVFIGSGEQSRIERKVLVHSLRTNTRRPLDVFVFNGTHNAIERDDEPPVPAPLALSLKYRSITEFSLYRYLIPELAGFRGRAIYLDSDMICLHDIGELADLPLDGRDFLALREAQESGGERTWGLSVMLIDCERCRFDLPAIFGDIDAGHYTYTEFSQMARRFLARRPYRVGELDPRWNALDRWDRDTRLIHYTNLRTQPWKFPRHPYGELWFSWFEAARRAGALREEDISLTMLRGYVRPDLLAGNSPPWAGRLRARLRRLLGARS